MAGQTKPTDTMRFASISIIVLVTYFIAIIDRLRLFVEIKLNKEIAMSRAVSFPLLRSIKLPSSSEIGQHHHHHNSRAILFRRDISIQ
jgi:hypothetical protein